MSSKPSRKLPAFKPYDQHQLMAFPPTFEELLPENHPARVVDQVINSIKIQPLLKAYYQLGASSYHPQCLLKVLVYAYVTNIYSSRKISQACRENVAFMWLSGMNRPDHNTINRFRGVRLKKILQKVFNEIVMLLAKEGLLSIEEVYTDGTKIEANANRYSFVWKNSILRNKEKMKQQLAEIWKYAQHIATEEDNLPPEPPTNQKIDQQRIKQTVDKLNEVLGKKDAVDSGTKNKLRHITKTYPARIEKYEEQEAILENRGSYSKTDTDATFMRMKDDHSGKGTLKPGYNVQISTSNQYIVNYSIHPNPTDTLTLIPHIELHGQRFGKLPKSVTADAGYGSQENYEFLLINSINPFVKYNMFDLDQRGPVGRGLFHSSELSYDHKKDEFTCPSGQPMKFIGTREQETSSGYRQTTRHYRTEGCSTCEMHGSCRIPTVDRVVSLNPQLEAYKRTATELLNSDQGRAHRKKRCYDVESVFGNIKKNHGFKRFMLRGKQKVEIEMGLLAIAQNIRKKAA